MARPVQMTKENIIAAAVELVRENGSEALNARALAAQLGSSTQPIFRNFHSMGEVFDAVNEYAASLYGDYLKKEIRSSVYPPYKASGMGYIRFAGAETQLFRLLFMRQRTEKESLAPSAEFEASVSLLTEQYGLSHADAERFHLSMWAFVHGIAVMYATGYLSLPEALVSEMVTECFTGLKAQYLAKEATK